LQAVFIVFVVLLAIFLLGRAIRHRSLQPFMPFRYNFGKRRDTFRCVLRMLSESQAKVLVETGTAREGLAGAKSNGASTVVFGRWAMENDAILHSVDISCDSIAASRAEVSKQNLVSAVRFYQQDSIEFLSEFRDPVDFLYLDSYDYDKLDTAVQKASQEHHLAEFKAIESCLHDKTLVLIDDCDLPNGGKGKLVIDYMLDSGWETVMEAYQVILARCGSASA
jgi:hypothetical protein